MESYEFVSLRQRPMLAEQAAEWFGSVWGLPPEAYLTRMNEYIRLRTEYGWYLCLSGGRIVGGLGVIDNDFHERKELSPNICAVYTDPAHRGKSIAGKLLTEAVDDLRSRGVSPVYLVTDHTGFYEKYGWEFLCMVKESGSSAMTRMYIHR